MIVIISWIFKVEQVTSSFHKTYLFTECSRDHDFQDLWEPWQKHTVHHSSLFFPFFLRGGEEKRPFKIIQQLESHVLSKSTCRTSIRMDTHWQSTDLCSSHSTRFQENRPRNWARPWGMSAGSWAAHAEVTSTKHHEKARLKFSRNSRVASLHTVTRKV
jgi:hypothetical protein